MSGVCLGWTWICLSPNNPCETGRDAIITDNLATLQCTVTRLRSQWMFSCKLFVFQKFLSDWNVMVSSPNQSINRTLLKLYDELPMKLKFIIVSTLNKNNSYSPPLAPSPFLSPSPSSFSPKGSLSSLWQCGKVLFL